MGRFSPTVLPQPVNPLAEALDEARRGYMQSRGIKRQQEFDEERREDREFRRGRIEEQDERTRRMRELDLALQGIQPGEAPTRTRERERPEVFEGVDVGRSMGEGEAVPEAPGAAEGPAAYDRTGGLAGALGEVRQQGRPRMIAPPGAFVPGQGFTTEALFDTPAARMGEHRRATTREETRPGYEQLTEDFHRDVTATPEARAAAQARREEDTTYRALERLEHIGPEQARALARGAPQGVVMPPEEDEDTIRVAGREFPNTPEGEQAALAWRRQHQAAGRDPRGPSAGRASFTEEELRQAGVPENRIPAALRDPVLARQLVGHAARPEEMSTGGRQRALAATRALEKLSEDAAEIQEIYSGTSVGDRMIADLNRRRREILDLYGYESIDELREEVRTLGPGRPRTEPGDRPEQDTATPGAAAGGDTDAAWKQRARELADQGHGREAIVAKLRQEGYVR